MSRRELLGLTTGSKSMWGCLPDEVEDDLGGYQRSSSGRVCLPVLEYWRNETVERGNVGVKGVRRSPGEASYPARRRRRTQMDVDFETKAEARTSEKDGEDHVHLLPDSLRLPKMAEKPYYRADQPEYTHYKVEDDTYAPFPPELEFVSPADLKSSTVQSDSERRVETKPEPASTVKTDLDSSANGLGVYDTEAKTELSIEHLFGEQS